MHPQITGGLRSSAFRPAVTAARSPTCWFRGSTSKTTRNTRTGDNAAARASLPPSLIGQGERTQADWLYQFLLNPQPVRRKSILRMPKFNMSNEEAKMLVDYFAAVTRQNNPGIGLQYPLEATPQRDDLDSPYWRQKTTEYIAKLKNADEGQGREGEQRYDERLAAYAPLWEQIRKDNDPAVKMDVRRSRQRRRQGEQGKGSARRKRTKRKRPTSRARSTRLVEELGSA